MKLISPARMVNPKTSWQQRGLLLLGLAVSLIGVQIINLLTGYQLSAYGILPRHLSGLPGILFTPWLHRDWAHLFANLPALLVLSALAMWDSITRYLVASGLIIVLGGGLVWLFGRSGIHIGASGWIFGLWAWLLVRAWFQRNTMNLVIALAILFCYGGLWWGFLPRSGISVEGHIAGALVGSYLGWLCRPQKY